MNKHIFSWMEKLGIPTKGLGFDYIKNTGLVGISRIVETLISYIIIVLISRYLGAEGLGQYSFIFGFAGLFFIFADLGLNSLMVKDLSKDFSNADSYISNIFSLKLILSILVFVAYFIFIFFVSSGDVFILLLIVGLMYFFNLFMQIGLSVLQVKSDGMIMSIIYILERVLSLTGAIFVLIIYQSLVLFMLVLFFSNLIKCFLFWFYGKKYFQFRFDLNQSLLFKLVKSAFPFLLIGGFSLIFIRIDTVMLGFMKSYALVGLYSSSYKLIDMLSMVPSLLLVFGFPTLSKLFVSDKNSAKLLFEKIISYSLIIVLPVIVGVFFVGERVLEFIYNFNSFESFIAFKILIIALLFIYLTTIMGYLISSADKQKVFAWIAGIGAFLNILLNFILIPKFSLYGAAFATLFTYLLMFILMYFYIRKEFFNFKIRFVCSLLASLMMGFMLSQILFLHLFWIIFISGVFYLIMLFLISKISFINEII